MIAFLASPAAAVPLTLGTALALGALTFVLSPLVSRRRPRFASRVSPASASARDAAGAYVSAIHGLQDAAFDHASDKLNPGDFAWLCDRLTRAAVVAMRQGEGLAAAAAVGITDDDIEAAIRRADRDRPSCRDCGPRPEADAIYCSNCGRYLPGQCATCGTEITTPASRYCQSCGTQLSPG